MAQRSRSETKQVLHRRLGRAQRQDEETLNGVLNHGHTAVISSFQLVRGFMQMFARLFDHVVRCQVWYALNSDMRLKFRRNAFGAARVPAISALSLHGPVCVVPHSFLLLKQLR